MDTKVVREELEYIPAKLSALRYVETVYECPKGKHTDYSYIVESEASASLMSHSLASASSVAWVMYQKYVNSMPLYRQEKEWEQIGLILSRAAVANWVIRCSYDYFTPVINRLNEELLKRESLHVDETPLQVLKEEGKKPQSKSYMWVYRTGNDEKAPIVIYDYQPSRNGDNAVNFLKDFRGYVHSDGFSGYNKLEGVTRCGCLIHIRRNFVEACTDKNESSSPKTTVEYGRHYCNILFDIERGIQDLSPEERGAKRLELEKPVLDEFWN